MRNSNFRRLGSALSHLPYPVAVRVIRALSGNRVVRRLLFPRTRRAIEDIYRKTCGIHCDDQATQLMIMSRTLCMRQEQMVPKLSDHEFKRYIRVDGLETVRDLCSSDRGVLIVAAHFTSVRALRPVLDRLGIRPYLLVRAGPNSVKTGRFITTYDKAPFFGIREAHEILKDGGEVMVLADGRQGSSDVRHQFLGRDCCFKGGIFDLAHSVGAAIVPVIVYTEIDGRVVVDFHPPLQIGDPDQPRESPMAGLVHSYADVLEAAIRARPWSFDPRRLVLFWGSAAADKQGTDV